MFKHCLATLCLLALTSSATGCNRYTRTKQCRALIAQINPALDDVLTLTGSGGAGGAGGAPGAGAGGSAGAASAASPSGGYIAAAGRYERLAKQLGPMEFAAEDMAKNVAEYVGILNSSAQTLRALASALDANNGAEVDKQNRELERIVTHERSVVGRMDTWCQP